jgi:hypothetical protein
MDFDEAVQLSVPGARDFVRDECELTEKHTQGLKVRGTLEKGLLSKLKSCSALRKVHLELLIYSFVHPEWSVSRCVYLMLIL